MPLPQTEGKELEITALGGLDLQGGELTRPANSWRRLENFDLVIPGTIKKIRGLKRIGNTVSPSMVNVLQDYQRTPEEDAVVVVVTRDGHIHLAKLPTFADLGDFDIGGDVPFVAPLPFLEFVGDEEITNQYLIITRGAANRPIKVSIDVAGETAESTLLGITNPTDTWDTAYQHSVVVWRAIPLAAATPPADTLEGYGLGVSLLEARRYRWSWYNPTLRKDSSLAAFYEPDVEFIYDSDEPSVFSTQGGSVRDTDNELVEIPLRWNGEDLEDALNLLPDPTDGDGYTHIRVWATPQGGSEYFLVRQLYNVSGDLVTDEDGAIPINANFPTLGLDIENDPSGETLFLFDGLGSRASENWVVDGAGQVGTSLNVKPASGTANNPAFVDNFRAVTFNHADRFTIGDDPTVYLAVQELDPILSIWEITPALAVSPDDEAVLRFLHIRPTDDSALIEPFEAERFYDPAPPAIWGATYQERLWLIPASDPTKIVFSEPRNYEAFPPDNYFQFLSSDGDSITALVTGKEIQKPLGGRDQRLVVGRDHSTAQITGTDFSNFERSIWHPATGIRGRRLAAVIGGYLLTLTRQGLELLEEQLPFFIGEKIRSIVDTFYGSPVQDPVIIQDSVQGMGLIAYKEALGHITNDAIIMLDSSVIPSMVRDNQSPFSLVKGLTTEEGEVLTFRALYESGIDGVKVLLGDSSGNVYRLFDPTSGARNGLADPIVAIAETQKIPTEAKTTRKLFRKLRLEGFKESMFSAAGYVLDSGWSVAFSVDDSDWLREQPLRTEMFIGLEGKQLVIKFTHDRLVRPEDLEPELSNFTVEFTTTGAAR